VPVEKIDFWAEPAPESTVAEPPANGHAIAPAYFDDIPPPEHVPETDRPKAVNGEIVPPEFADDALALRFAYNYGNALRYVALWGRWMHWDGAVWRRDETLGVYDLVRRQCRVASSEAQHPTLQTKLASGNTVASVEKMARSDRRLAAKADQWDSDPWLLNTPGGIVDLRTGEMGPHRSDAHMTKSTAVSPGGGCPMWLEFLDRITAHNLLLRDYLKRVGGYCLTGVTNEHAMFFGYGVGRNGKGTFINTFADILADYAMNADSDTFTASGAGKHLTVLARLQGARLVVSQETEEGVPWAEARIKACTGGDKITANFMRQDPFEYTPQFKLFITGNHKPGLASVDEAIKGRFNLIPFTVTIPPSERDPGLSEKLKSEWPGILAWAIEGCLDWQAVRLRAPAIVSEATDQYFESEDAVSLWIADCCVKNGDELSGVLFRSWMTWAIKAGEKPGSHKAFGRMMEKHGFPTGKRTPKGMPIIGIRLIPRPMKNRTEPEENDNDFNDPTLSM